VKAFSHLIEIYLLAKSTCHFACTGIQSLWCT